MGIFMVNVETGQKIDLSGGIPELTLEDVQEEPAADARLYASFLSEPIEIILQAKIPTLPRQWRRSGRTSQELLNNWPERSRKYD